MHFAVSKRCRDSRESRMYLLQSQRRRVVRRTKCVVSLCVTQLLTMLFHEERLAASFFKIISSASCTSLSASPRRYRLSRTTAPLSAAGTWLARGQFHPCQGLLTKTGRSESRAPRQTGKGSSCKPAP